MLPGEKPRKSSKHRDDATAGKKRQRESNQTEKTERKHKKSRRDAAPDLSQATGPVDGDEAPKQKRSKGHRSSKVSESDDVNGAQSQSQPQYETTVASNADENVGDASGERSERKKKHKESKQSKQSKESKKSKKKKSREPQEQDDDDDDPFTDRHRDVVVLASSRSKKILGTAPAEHLYPFYTQTVSQYLPLHPLGINEPIEGYVHQHLEPLLNRYVPIFAGVLLAYRNPRIGEAPGSSSLSQDAGMEDTAMLESINEYAVSFGWLTVEIDIFRPSRGAWLEGLVNIQSEGHIGVVCWGKFNASIECERLPRDWQWVEQHPSSEKNGETDAEAPSSEASPHDGDNNNNNDDDDEAAEHTEVHTTGYWVDGEGSKITADKPIRLRIKNYEVGTSGDYGYLSIEGTMLGEAEEEEKARKEMEALVRGKAKPGSALRRHNRGLLELGITKFTNDGPSEPGSQRTAA